MSFWLRPGNSLKRAGAEIGAVLLGHGVKSFAQDLLAYGADRVFLADHPSLEKYLTLPYTRVIAVDRSRKTRNIPPPGNLSGG